MSHHRFTTQVSKEQILSLHTGEVVYLTGKIFTARDKAHQLILNIPRKKIPTEIRGLPLYHCGPLVTRKEGHWQVISAGPTTSRRMESSETAVMQKLNVRLLIGKGGMGPATAMALQRQPGIYLAYTGGAGVFAAEQITGVLDVLWLDELGMADAVWLLEVREFGPLVVAMDAHGASLYPRETA